MTSRFSSSPGFGLLLAVIIVSIVAMMIGLSLAFLSMREGDLSLSMIFAKRAEAIADACLEEAAYRLKADATYTGAASLGSGTDGTCSITVAGSNPFQIAITATANGSTRKITATVTISTPPGNPPPPQAAAVSQWAQVTQ